MASPLPEVRNLHFALEAVPVHWHAGGRALSRLFDNMSIFFPAGERFFVSSVHAYKDRITDPALAERVRRFAGQEGMHAREHDRYNAHLAAQGLPIEELEGRVKKLLAGAQQRLPRRLQLAATCALEHFTALMAREVLGDPRVLADAHPTMRELWTWHAIEEAEHKTIPFDVFRAIGGTERERARAMLVATVLFWAHVARHQVTIMRADGMLYDAREWAKLFWFIFVSPGTLRRTWGNWAGYFRRSFHPDDVDDAAAIDAWRRAHASEAAA